MTRREELQQVQEAAEVTLKNLMEVLHRSPELTSEIRSLMSATDQVQEYTALVMQKPQLADQILRISLATLGNYQLADEVRRKLGRVSENPTTQMPT